MKTAARLGQHFLRSQPALEAIIEAGAVSPGDPVLEIGPGEGVLTRALLARGAKVTALEKDEALCARLREAFAQEIASGALRLVEGDALDFDPASFEAGSYKLIANIPYYITGQIIRKFLTARAQPREMVLLIQKEVAERIAKDPKESILSISVKAYGAPKIVRKVPRGSFSPPPSVDSAILSIAGLSRDFFSGLDEAFFFKVVRAGFSSKRKKLSSNLSGFGKERVATAFRALDIDANARAEGLSAEQWGRLARALSSRN